MTHLCQISIAVLTVNVKQNENNLTACGVFFTILAEPPQKPAHESENSVHTITRQRWK